MLKKIYNKKKDNKGFTLVELVVVVAILAILVGLLAPQYTKYVERSRQSADASNIENMVRAVEIQAADPTNPIPAGDYEITMDSEGTEVTTDTDDNMLAAAIEDTVGENWNTTGIRSTLWGSSDGEIVVSINIDSGATNAEDSGAITVTYSPESFADYVGKTATTS